MHAFDIHLVGSLLNPMGGAGQALTTNKVHTLGGRPGTSLTEIIKRIGGGACRIVATPAKLSLAASPLPSGREMDIDDAILLETMLHAQLAEDLLVKPAAQTPSYPITNLPANLRPI